MMKKIFALVLLLVLGKLSYAQYPITQTLGSDSTIVISKGALQSRLINVTYTDTAAANLQRIRQYPGAQIATTTGGLNLWIRNATATAWIPVATGSGNNIYTIDGTLLGNRTLTGGGNSLTFTGLSQFLLTVGNQTFTVSSDSASLTRKLSYASNRGSTFTLYSLVDKNYVDSAITSSPAGTVTQINTNNNTGITGGPITSTGTLAIDTLLISTRAWRQKGVDSLQANINLKLNIVDTTGMLASYVNSVGYGLGKTSQTVYVDSASLSNYYLRRKDSLTATNPLGYVTKKVLADTAAAIRSSDLGGTVTSVATNNGTGITGGTITTSGTLAIDTTVISTRAWRQKGVDSLQANINLKLNISDTANMLNPYLRKVDTTNIWITNVYRKTATDSVFYVKGGNSTFAYRDSIGSGGGGGGGGKVYYLNGSVNQGTFGGLTMYALGDTAITGASADFTRATTGTIANFITNVNQPYLISIPSGIWVINAYMSESGGGANHAEVYAILETWNGSTLTSIATSPIEEITNGSTPDLYTFGISLPTTTISLTDRIVIQFYIQNTNGKTVTLYTQNGKVGEVITTFTTGIGALNGLTAPSQFFATGTSGTDFNISSVTATHTFNLPVASGTNTGKLSSTDWSTFNNKVGGTLLNGYLTKATGTNTIDTSQLFQSLGLIGIGTTSPTQKLQVSGNAYVNGQLFAGDTALSVYQVEGILNTPYVLGRKAVNNTLSTEARPTGVMGHVVGRGSIANRLQAANFYTTTDSASTANSTGSLRSVNAWTAHNGSGSLTTAWGSYNIVQNKTTGTITNAYGSVSGVENRGATSTINKLHGTTTEIWNNFGGTVDTAFGQVISIYNNNAASNIGAVYGLSIGKGLVTPTGGTHYWKNSGTIGTSYGLYLDTSIDVGTTKYSIFSNSNSNSYFKGKLGVGTTSPDSAFQVATGALFQRGVRMSALPQAPGTKALRIDASGTISYADTLIDAGGTVTSVATNNGTGITGGTITTTGTLAIDTLLISTRAWRQKGIDSLQANLTAGLATKLNISDTASMLSPYLRSNVAAATYVPQTRTITINGTSQDLSANRTYNVGTVTSVATNTGTGITGGTITSSGTIAADTLLLSTRAWRQKGVDSVASLINTRISGTTNYIPKFTSSSAIGNSAVTDNGSITTSLQDFYVSKGNAMMSITSTNTGGFSVLRLQSSGISDLWFGRESSTSSIFGLTPSSSVIYSEGAHPFITFVNGSERMRLTASGNLGLGVTPSAWTVFNPVLQVKTGSLASSGTANFRMFANTFYDGAYKYIGTGTATQYEQDGYHAWYTAPSGTAGNAISFTQAMTLASTGNLLVGGTSDGGYRLNVTGNAYINANTGALTSDILTVRGGGVSGAYGLRVEANNGDDIFYTDNFSYNVIANPVAGRFGIGTTSPSAKLHIGESGAAAQLWLQRTDGYNPVKLIGGTLADGSGFKITMNTTDAFAITSGGLVGIGTTSPAVKLHIVGGGEPLRIESTNGSGGNYVQYKNASGDLGYIGWGSTSSDQMTIFQGKNADLAIFTNSAERMRITSGGDLLIATTTDAGAYPLQVNGSVYATAYYESSDLRLKNVLSERQGSDGINTITFKWKDGRDSLTHIGYAAQQVEKVLPDAVKTNTDGYKTINYDEVQSLKIANLEQEIAELKKIIKQLIDKK